VAALVAWRTGWTLLKAVSRGLLWELPLVSREIRRWSALAATIPDPSVREEALDAIAHKRENTAGAALYTIVPNRRNARLLRLLVAYQIIFDFLDNLTELYPGPADALRFYLALAEALDPQTPVSDYFEHRSCGGDGGYLRALVETCQAGCATFPSYSELCPHLRAAVAPSVIQGVIHDPVPERREAALRAWAMDQPCAERTMTWFEVAALVTGFVPYGLLALASEGPLDIDVVVKSLAAYLPWIALTMTMLDGYADMPEDAASGAHCYIDCYENAGCAGRRLTTIIERSMDEARKLPHGDRHAILIASMVAMYLSSDHAQAREMRAQTRTLARAGGALTCMLLPVLRLWRTAYLRRATDERRCKASAVRRLSQAGHELPRGSSLPRAAQAFLSSRESFDQLDRCRARYRNRFTIRTISRPPFVVLGDLADSEEMLVASPNSLDPGGTPCVSFLGRV
jgi:tetraprenyl-beta-curcumene synthase